MTSCLFASKQSLSEKGSVPNGKNLLLERTIVSSFFACKPSSPKRGLSLKERIRSSGANSLL